MVLGKTGVQQQAVTLSIPTDDGAMLAVTEVGNGPLVLLSHCWTGSRAIWAPVAERLVEAGYRVITYDQRGHGESTIGSDGWTIQRIGEDLAHVLQHIEGKVAILAGHSLGGMIQALALHRPEAIHQHVDQVALVATAAYGVRANRLRKLAARVISSSLLERVMRTGSGPLFVRMALGPRARAADVKNTCDHFVACPATVRGSLLAAMHEMDLRGLKSLDVPVTVIHGTLDFLTPPSRGRELAERLGAEMVWKEGVGHMLPLEVPDQVAEQLMRTARSTSAPHHK